MDFEYDKDEVKLVEEFKGVNEKSEPEKVKILFELLDEITHSLKKVIISTASAEYIFETSHE